MNTLLRIGLVVAAGATSTAAAAAPSCGSGEPIKFAAVPWKSGQFYAEVIRTILERGYGCRTELVAGTAEETQALLTSDGVQLWVELWGGRAEVIKKGLTDGKIRLVGDLLEGGSVEGWYVPEFVVKGDPRRGLKPLAPDLENVADLHRYKDLFKSGSKPGKGNFVNCPAGWDCEKNNNQKLKAYGLAGEFDNYRPSSGAVMDMLIAAGIAVDKPMLFYYWSPSALMGRFKLIKLREPAYNETCWKTIYDATSEKPCGSATPPTTLSIGVSTPFAANAPALVNFIEKVRLTPEQVNQAVFRMTERTESASAEARYFLKGNPAAWRDWVPEPIAAKVRSGL